jgi:hypothetical protein
VVLRHQVAILRRGGRRPRYTVADRALLAAVSRLLPPGRWSCFAVSPQTLRRWHRAFVEGDRRGRGRRPGRPPLAAETRSLILRMARENPRWGYLRIQGELLKLRINVSATTVATVLRVSGLGPAPRRIGPSWSEFLARPSAQCMLGAGLRFEPAWRTRGQRVRAERPNCGRGGLRRESRAALHQRCRAAVVRLAGARSAAAVGCRRCAFSPRLAGRATAASAAIACARWTKNTPQLFARTVRQWCQTVGRSRPARELQPQVGFPVTAARLFTPAAAPQRGEHHSEPAVEPSFFTPHRSLVPSSAR